ncbi:MAG: Lrp/AsnC family transcriptional regulator [Acidobacteriota bacterium]|nr:Lrp/AsnC family transcriptional regulator [Acidobacteriota bacterium]
MINEIDTKILTIIQQDARISNADIARQVGLAPSAVLERVRKLEERGVIRGYAAEIDAASIGFGLTAFVFVRTNECGDPTDKLLANIPEVLEVHDVAGEESYLLKVRAKNTEELAKLLREKIKAVPNVLLTRTTVVLQTIKETTALPLENLGADSGETAKRKPRKNVKSPGQSKQKEEN